MKKFWIQTIALTLIIFAAFYLYHDPTLLQPYLPNTTNLNEIQLKVGTNIIKIEVADTPQKRAQGLGGRESIAPDTGMLFIFDSSSRYQFWMKNMKFPLDIIYINQGQVVDFLKNVPSPSPQQKDADLPIYSPTVEVDMVLEVNSGYIDTNKINIGDSVLLVK